MDYLWLLVAVLLFGYGVYYLVRAPSFADGPRRPWELPVPAGSARFYGVVFLLAAAGALALGLL